MLAAHTTIPVIGVPIAATALNGLDALFAIAQMPSGIPVASMAVGKAGATNAGIFAAQILALKYEEIAKALRKAYSVDPDRDLRGEIHRFIERIERKKLLVS